MPDYVIDTVRILHLLCFALGLGVGLSCDLRGMRRFNSAFTTQDILEFERGHRLVSYALIGLWVTGLALIYIRTGFVVADFSPKLWVKVIIVTLLTVNAVVIGRLVMPYVAEHVGSSVVSMSLGKFVAMTLAAAISMFCWLSGLALGASVTLKTADWDMLGQVLWFEFLIVVPGAVLCALLLRAYLAPSTRGLGQKQS
jgi:hypothetical protein